ncbi:MAG TPA: metalloregulator ArsR/SmtB family transcription factor [Thermoanaerobaculia bacterium]|nr:metalloregulator ArsR/SmtB family transcription factor [Thermoanaerobaculia bacterium]
MVNYSAASAAATLDRTFRALSDPTRRTMLERLAAAPETPVAELARPFRMSKPAISKHLRVLEEAGLLARRRQGRVHHLRLVPAPLESADDWLGLYRAFWEEKLDALERYLRESESAASPDSRPSKRRRRPPRS